jgi:hypothetical protein
MILGTENWFLPDALFEASGTKDYGSNTKLIALQPTSGGF